LTGNKIQTNPFFTSDTAFNQLYAPGIRALSHSHWTGLEVARKSAAYLAAEKKTKILDIGSGVGKFCLAAAYYFPASFFYGVEQRQSLIDSAEAAKAKLGFANVSFIHENFTKLNFKQYDHFYFYNAFYENLTDAKKIDTVVEYSKELYDFYTFNMYRQLEKMPAGTKLVTYHVAGDEWPRGYHIVGTDMDDDLNFLVKV
jgi:SAM-dependent methyltransferase